MNKTKKIWLDGKLVDWEKAKIHLLTHALHYGSGVFEGVRCYQTDKGPAIFRLDEHLERLFNSAKYLEMKVPFSQKELKKAVLQTIRANKINECYIRPIAFYGYGKMGLDPQGAPVSVGIALWPWGKYLAKESIAVKISKFIRLHPQSVPAEAKVCGYYVNSIFATLDVKKQGFDEALLLDYQGFIAEGPGENIFLVKNKILYTPSLLNILSGITRDSIIKIAKDLKIKVKEKKIKPRELKIADEAFFTGTAVEVCPITKIDKTLINKGKIGGITLKLKEVFERIIRGKEKKYLKWLTFVK
ncbi:branched chain amino acid aminotransferase [bacterium (Candidatus Moisslbacteria) CG12_big_fil_rev_8_21_14_0_65_36_11]|nr:branched-chain amino acid transaminase [Candidatus Kuenenbacteria bacterium]OIP76670.1 MAG: branched chain amino acid aminotransferase [Parcubacteria group bacterium CG2_30_36_38]PIV46098.1 MAG: branched chain amino acid aminotransferase [bacterium (Candidatus Moisslbacteria) CG02_land_8_20_14_3_00_36_53]PIW67638.1 MAG: branched chain amino acid aminotransferase [bacterium (Candidatus Moisslbacteria) CG12_big_fil_rev_8_21_14_0_65_36_11]PIZ90263.1 MAG: branched chain amino acid aminotransfera